MLPNQPRLACGPFAHSQDIRIKVLNGRNGKPTTNECLNISVGLWHGADLLPRTNGEGVVTLHLRGGGVTAEGTCDEGIAKGGPKQFPRDSDAIAIVPDYYVACQEYGKVVPGDPVNPNTLGKLVPAYSTKKILESGLSASNRCGRFRAEAKPGELIFFVRPPSWLELLRR